MQNKMLKPAVLGLTLAISACAGTTTKPVAPPEVVRYKGGANFPIAMGVEVPAGKAVVYLSGALAPVSNPSAPKDSMAAYGDTKTQTMGALKTIEANLKGMGLSMKDVVKMTVFLAGDPGKGGKLDFEGMMAAYTQFFGTAAQPNLPARSTVQVAALVRSQYLVEIEVIAVRP
jgi:enamine deaminase RidA (YjgF/YER057c/UK114 family)